MPSRRGVLTAVAAFAGAPRSFASAPTLRYLKAPRDDLFSRYAVDVLDLALKKSGLPHRLEAVTHDWMTQGRMELEMARPDAHLNVMWAMTSKAREAALCPLRVPLDRGLLGWRVPLIRSVDLPSWRPAPTRKELARRSAGQGLQWPDVEILRANGFSVETAANTSNLFEMLKAGHVDYFPRSVLEAQDELLAYGGNQLAIAPELVIRYPTASYAFLSQNCRLLVSPLTRALDDLARDGGLVRVFNQYFLDQLDPLSLPARHVIPLENPLLPAATPLKQADFWWRP